jgi:hypothetical protein
MSRPIGQIYGVLVSAATRDSPSPKKLKRICDMRFTERVDHQGRTRRDMVPFSKPVLAQCALWNYVNELIELVRWAR